MLLLTISLVTSQSPSIRRPAMSLPADHSRRATSTTAATHCSAARAEQLDRDGLEPATGLRPTLLLLAAAGEDLTPLLKAARARLTADQDAVVLPLRPDGGEAL
jgi:hypothetical protein